jgi:hypothetical protein
MAGADSLTFFEKSKTLLENCRETGDLVAVYANPEDTASFEVGTITDVSEEALSMSCVDSNGRPNGTAILRFCDVQRIDVGTEYLRSVETLVDVGTGIEVALGVPASIPEALNQAKVLRRIVTLIDEDDESVAGFVSGVGADYVQLEQVTESGADDGFVLVALDCIRKVECDRQGQVAMRLLHEKRHGK